MTEIERNRLLEEMIAKVLRESMMDTSSSIRKVYVAFDTEWHHENYRLWEQLHEYRDYQVHAIVPESMDDAYRQRVEEIYPFLSYKTDQTMYELKEEDILLIPYMQRNDAIWIAQGLACSPMSKIVKQAFQDGAHIYIFPTSIEALTGKEPMAYQEMILTYYRQVLELGISYIHHVKETLVRLE